jgi:hypothetical protein
MGTYDGEVRHPNLLLIALLDDTEFPYGFGTKRKE